MKITKKHVSSFRWIEYIGPSNVSILDPLYRTKLMFGWIYSLGMEGNFLFRRFDLSSQLIQPIFLNRYYFIISERDNNG